ncbi:D-glycero-beta-D-manno-heptose 1,7-bisphosphate 7-phosphatase [Ideonella dechloratans]|uniref:D,D-heptose 1,7-bisphosphate phosphatase n=1 Tax=Ideonella dechloratans TaxID=36863 RepID=A0A643FEJ5_IDEDE|nr:D-glycero-beta-D-manno-heptose 1,7-bisphosphate 7-phosphatase [Ideonella dechloratans]KAB0583522.1 D-glycero-beta-D-manno-heptose 1,7-bisphosphate 7-phosphatase [Ideonella dechloratans]UFU09065.1 D-glycero-beta-D-manno-heptose 1,7-bisphosphate 7-phosphatase [Ideonella dechloratans]
MSGVKTAFLDRDGVINVDVAYLSRWKDFRFVPGTVDALRQLQALGYQLVVVTNQSGIARGYYTEDDYQALTCQMRQALADEGVTLAGVYHCPHLPGAEVARYAQDCDCRKPAPGMILRAARELGADLPASILVGDKDSDIQAARAAGVGRAFLVRSGQDLTLLESARADACFDDLADCVSALAP